MRDTLRHGSRGADVRRLQGMLITLGAPIKADGEFGDVTFDVVCDFQSWKQLDPDGVVGPKTWAAIENAMKLHETMKAEIKRNLIGIEPCTAAEALSRMSDLAKIRDAEYILGTGDFNPKGYVRQYDCAGAAICEAYKLTRHRLGFASGTPPYEATNDVDDDINTNSALEDAMRKQEVFELVPDSEPVLPGDLVMWATIHLVTADGETHTFIGHVLMAKVIPAGWKRVDGWHLVRFLQCCGGNGRTPAVIETDGSVIDRHNAKWPKPGMRAYVVRVKQPIPH